jgi:hypothetical protein
LKIGLNVKIPLMDDSKLQIFFDWIVRDSSVDIFQGYELWKVAGAYSELNLTTKREMLQSMMTPLRMVVLEGCRNVAERAANLRKLSNVKNS